MNTKFKFSTCHLIILLIFSFVGKINATDRYVDASSAVSGDGSIGNPYKTIQEATNAASKGDVIIVRAGTYREEIKLPISGLTFKAYDNEVATINGADLLNGWILESGSTYKTTMNWKCDSANGGNQLFVDRTMINLARWPDQTSIDIVKPNDAIAENVVKGVGFKEVIITDNEFNEPDGRWDGAQIWINLSNQFDGEGWTAKVISSSQVNHTITVDLGMIPRFGNQAWNVGPGTEYYLFNPTHNAVVASGGVDALLSNGEWWRDGNIIYVKTPNGLVPNETEVGTNIVEAKKRQFCFYSTDPFVNRSNITIKNFSLFATSITTDVSYLKRSKETIEDAQYIVIDGIKAKYVTHFTNHAGDMQNQWTGKSGIILSGMNNTLKNCTIQYSSGPAVCIMGYGNKMLNNVIQDGNYGNTNSGAVNTSHHSIDCEIGYNTIFNTPMQAIYFNGFINSDIKHRGVARIHHNKVYNFLRRGWDSGAIDEVANDGQYVRIDHNEIFNTLPDAINGGGRFALYFDFGADPDFECQGRYIADHNVIYNVNGAMQSNCLRNLLVYNNVMLSTNECSMSNGIANLQSKGGGFEDTIKNNIMNGLPNIWDGGNAGMSKAYIKNNVAYQTSKYKTTPPAILSGNSLYLFPDQNTSINALFFDPANHDYQLKSSAAVAIDKGVLFNPFNDSINNGIVDIGAYEYGKPKWKAGKPDVFSPVITPNGGDFYDSVLVSIASDSIGEIRYTLNGTDPIATSSLYVAPFYMKDSSIIKVRLFVNALKYSETASANFGISNPNLPLREPENPTGVAHGVIESYFTFASTDKITKLPDLDTYTPNRVDTVSMIDLSSPHTEDYYMFQFNGFIEVPVDGTYTFYTNSDDGSKLYIGSTLVVNNDGTHPPTSMSGIIGLKAGVHALKVEFLEVGGGDFLSVSYKGPTLAKGYVLTEVLWHQAYVERPAKVLIVPHVGKFTQSVNVGLSCSTPGSNVYYTIDGSTPTAASMPYVDSIAINTTTMIKAIAINNAMPEPNSLLDSVLFEKTAYPVLISPKTGSFVDSVMVTLTSKTVGASIYYTTDGTIPTAASKLYSVPFKVNTITTVKTMASSVTLAPSVVTTAAYAIFVDTVMFSSVAECFVDSLAVTLVCNTPNSSIRYTINGATPTITSPEYITPIVIKSSSFIKTIAFKNNLNPSVFIKKTVTQDPKCVNGIHDNNSASLTIYPNPCDNGIFTLTLNEMKQKDIIQMKIYDMQGRLMIHKSFNADTEVIQNTESLSSGMYIVTISNAQLNEQIKLIVK